MEVVERESSERKGKGKGAVVLFVAALFCIRSFSIFLEWFVVMYHFGRGLLGFDVACVSFTSFLWFFYSSQQQSLKLCSFFIISTKGWIFFCSTTSLSFCIRSLWIFLESFVVMYHFGRGLLGFDVACASFTSFLWFFDSSQQ